MTVRLSEKNIKGLKDLLYCTDAEIREAEEACDPSDISMHLFLESDLPVYAYYFFFPKHKAVVAIPCSECRTED